MIPPTFGSSLLTLAICCYVLVTDKQFKEMMHMMEPLAASMNETFNKTTTSMNEMLHKSQASTEATLEWMQHGIAAMADRVQALET